MAKKSMNRRRGPLRDRAAAEARTNANEANEEQQNTPAPPRGPEPALPPLVDPWVVAQRYLILGAESGPIEQGAQANTPTSISCLQQCISEDGPRVIKMIVAISHHGRAPKNDPAVQALALAASAEPRDDSLQAQMDSAQTRKMALQVMPQVCRTGAHLLHFVAAVKARRGWGRGLRRPIAAWYEDKEIEQLALQLVKYWKRAKWSHRDVMRVVHPKAAASDKARQALFSWVCGKDPDDPSALPFTLQAHDEVRQAATLSDVVKAIQRGSLPREAVPERWLVYPEVWSALLATMDMGAMIRSLGHMTACNLLTPNSSATRYVLSCLRRDKAFEAARVHPLQVLNAARGYARGEGIRGKGAWEPVPEIVDALSDLFYRSFQTVDWPGARVMLALDVSQSKARIAGGTLTLREAAAAMALVTLQSDPRTLCVAFGHPPEKGPGSDRPSVTTLPITASDPLDKVLSVMRRLPGCEADCALPINYALDNRIEVDAFVIYTDCVSSAGKTHPTEALRRYREVMGIDAKLIIVSMAANEFSIADPRDPRMVDIVGFDTATPALIADFLRDP